MWAKGQIRTPACDTTDKTRPEWCVVPWYQQPACRTLEGEAGASGMQRQLSSAPACFHKPLTNDLEPTRCNCIFLNVISNGYKEGAQALHLYSWMKCLPTCFSFSSPSALRRQASALTQKCQWLLTEHRPTTRLSRLWKWPPICKLTVVYTYSFWFENSLVQHSTIL